jgi:hypothetical protein
MAWFHGKTKTAHYCVNVDKNFGLKAQDVQLKIQAAAETWVNYLQTKHYIGPKAGFDLDLTTSFVLNPSCQGNEELSFYFGESNDQIEKLKKGYFQPVAFSEMTNDAFDQHQGIVWVTNPGVLGGMRVDWQLAGALDLILLHEFGHIFGSTHADDTVMARNMGEVVFRAIGNNNSLQVPIAIDQSHELLTCHDCTYEFTELGHAQLQSRFRKLVGRDPLGRATGTLILNEGKIKTGVVTLRDDISATSFSIQVQKEVVWRNGDGTFNGNGANYGGAYYGSLQLPSGQKLPITLSRNLSYSVEIVDLDGTPVPGKEDDSDFFHGHSFRILN